MFFCYLCGVSTLRSIFLSRVGSFVTARHRLAKRSHTHNLRELKSYYGRADRFCFCQDCATVREHVGASRHGVLSLQSYKQVPKGDPQQRPSLILFAGVMLTDALVFAHDNSSSFFCHTRRIGLSFSRERAAISCGRANLWDEMDRWTDEQMSHQSPFIPFHLSRSSRLLPGGRKRRA